MDMKLFKNCNVAVCFSGESRTFVQCAESIKRFFNNENPFGNKYYFFGHTWDANNYKAWPSPNVSKQLDTEELDKKKLLDDLTSLLPFKQLEVEDQFIKTNYCLSTLYSRLKANYLKQRYEIKNNMMFDLVIKTRFDLCYKPNQIFENYFLGLIEEKTLYSSYGFMRNEFYLPNPDEVFYFGSSLTMDIIEDLYNSFQFGGFNIINKTGGEPNKVWNKVGPGALIHRWASLRNVLIKQIPQQIPYAIIRKHTLHLNPIDDFDQIKRREQGAQ